MIDLIFDILYSVSLAETTMLLLRKSLLRKIPENPLPFYYLLNHIYSTSVSKKSQNTLKLSHFFANHDFRIDKSWYIDCMVYGIINGYTRIDNQ